MPPKLTLVVTAIGLAMVIALLVFKPTGWREIGHAILVVLLVLVVVRIIAEVIAVLSEKPMTFSGGRLKLFLVMLLSAGIAALIVWWFPS